MHAHLSLPCACTAQAFITMTSGRGKEGYCNGCVLTLSPKARAGIFWPLLSTNLGCLSGEIFLLSTTR